jgi:pimeloyl-ACP methyl ester carboxylesterase
MKERNFSALGPHGFHRIHYYEWGHADNPRVLVCVHGLTRSGRDFDALAKAMAREYRVICPDIVGRGKSGWLTHKEDYGYPLYCADMAALIARSGAETVDWVGTSMGGIIGMLIAAHAGNPVRRLVVNDVGPFIPKTALERLKNYVGKDPLFDSLEEAENYVRLVAAPFGPHSDEQWRHLTETTVSTRENGKWGLVYDPSLAHAFSGPMTDVDLWHFWDQIRCPTLLTRGTSSDLLLEQTAHEMTRRGPKAKLVEFDGIGHAPTLMAADQIQVVRKFLLAGD